MKRAVIMNTSFALVKIHMEMTKYDINFSDNCNKVLVYSNHDKRVVLCKLSAAIILSFMTWELRSPLIVKCVFRNSLSYTAIMLNIITMYHMQKASSLPKNLTTLKPSPTISDVGVGLFAQSFNAFWTSGLNWRTLAATLTKCLIFLVIHFFSFFF